MDLVAVPHVLAAEGVGDVILEGVVCRQRAVLLVEVVDSLSELLPSSFAGRLWAPSLSTLWMQSWIQLQCERSPSN